jgi:hypothetical protein
MCCSAVQARIMPKDMTMEIELDVDWQMCGSHIVIDSLVDVGDKKWNAKVTIMELVLQGRMLFVLKLSKTMMPGIEGMSSTASAHLSSASHAGPTCQGDTACWCVRMPLQVHCPSCTDAEAPAR